MFFPMKNYFPVARAHMAFTGIRVVMLIDKVTTKSRKVMYCLTEVTWKSPLSEFENYRKGLLLLKVSNIQC